MDGPLPINERLKSIKFERGFLFAKFSFKGFALLNLRVDETFPPHSCIENVEDDTILTQVINPGLNFH